VSVHLPAAGASGGAIPLLMEYYYFTDVIAARYWINKMPSA